MLTLPDPKHEAFATLRASGHDLAAAYVHAGYSVKNVKTRARKLQRNPHIQARIEYLKTCLPRIAELHDHHCPTLLLMPETRHEMLVWLWQVMSGARLIKPAQMRAATLYCRLQGWHLAKLLPESTAIADAADPPPVPSSTLTEDEKTFLASSNRENIAHERTLMPRSPENLARYQSILATLAHPHCRQDAFGRPLPDLISKSTPDPLPTPATPAPATASPSTAAPNPTLPVRHVPQVRPVRPVLPLPPSPSTSQPPVLHPAPQAPGPRPSTTIPPQNPQSHPHPKPLTLNRLKPIHPQPRTFFLSSKADPASAGSIPSRLPPPPQKSPRPLAAAH